MPYRTSGKNVYVKKGGTWKKKATARTPTAAKRMVRLLRAVKHGWHPTGAPAKNALMR